MPRSIMVESVLDVYPFSRLSKVQWPTLESKHVWHRRFVGALVGEGEGGGEGLAEGVPVRDAVGEAVGEGEGALLGALDGSAVEGDAVGLLEVGTEGGVGWDVGGVHVMWFKRQVVVETLSTQLNAQREEKIRVNSLLDASLVVAVHSYSNFKVRLILKSLLGKTTITKRKYSLQWS